MGRKQTLERCSQLKFLLRVPESFVYLDKWLDVGALRNVLQDFTSSRTVASWKIVRPRLLSLPVVGQPQRTHERFEGAVVPDQAHETAEQEMGIAPSARRKHTLLLSESFFPDGNPCVSRRTVCEAGGHIKLVGITELDHRQNPDRPSREIAGIAKAAWKQLSGEDTLRDHRHRHRAGLRRRFPSVLN